MKTFLVVLAHSGLRGLLHFRQCAENIHVKHFIPIGPLEPLDVGVLRRSKKLRLTGCGLIGANKKGKIIETAVNFRRTSVEFIWLLGGRYSSST